MSNLAALSAAVFSLSAKNLRGADNRPPPPAVRGLIDEMRPPYALLSLLNIFNGLACVYSNHKRDPKSSPKTPMQVAR